MKTRRDLIEIISEVKDKNHPRMLKSFEGNIPCICCISSRSYIRNAEKQNLIYATKKQLSNSCTSHGC